jgi:hypothetical protein
VYLRLKLSDVEEVVPLDYAALLHNLRYCATGHTSQPSVDRHFDEEPAKSIRASERSTNDFNSSPYNTSINVYRSQRSTVKTLINVIGFRFQVKERQI